MGQKCPHFDKGVYYYQQGLHQKAIQAFTQALEHKQKPVQSHYNRALTYDALHQYQQAIFDYTQAIQKDKQHPDAKTFLNRGLAYKAIMKYDKALEDFSEAIRLDSKLVSAYNSRGNLYKRLNRYEDAIQDYTSAISLDGFRPVLYYNRGLSYASVQNFAKAILDFSATLNLDSKDVLAYNNRGVAHSHLQQYEQAQTDYLSALKLKPNYPLAMFNLAECYTHMQKKSKGAKCFEQAIDVFRTGEEATRQEYDLSEGNVRFIKEAINDYKGRKDQLQELEQQAMNLGRTDIIQNIYTLFEKNQEMSIKSTAKVGKQPEQQQLSQSSDGDLASLQREMRKMREEITKIRRHNQQLQERVGKVQQEQQRLKQQIDKISLKVFAMERVTHKIEQIDSKKKSQYFDRLYRTLLGHFLAYKILSTGFFVQNTRAFSMKQDVVSSICTLHPYVGSIPVIGPMVMMPFNIIAKIRSVKTTHLNTVIARKVGSSNFVTQQYLNSAVAYVIQRLIDHREFNQEVMQQIYRQEQSTYHKLTHLWGKAKGYIYSEVLDSTQIKFSYVEQLVILHMTQVTEELTDIQAEDFKAMSKDKDSFYQFVLNGISRINLKKEFDKNGLGDDPPDTNRGMTGEKTELEGEQEEEERKGIWSCLRCHC